MQPIGAVLAGGAGRRMGADKASVELAGRPLISYALRAIGAVLEEVVVVAKPRTHLPELPGMTVWLEREERQHPLVGVVHALERAGGRSVLVCAVDLPLVTSTLIRRLVEADSAGAPAILASGRGQVQPLLGRYEPTALELLRPLAAEGEIAVRTALASIDPLLFEVDDPEALHNVNSQRDLRAAAAMLERRHPRMME